MRQDARKALNQTADLAARALHFLIADGKLALRDVTTALSRRKKLIKQLKDRFTALETEVTAAAAKARKAASPKTASGRPRKAAARKAASAKARKSARAVTKKKTVARSARKKARVSRAKAAVSSKPSRHTRPRTIAARTKKPAQIAVTAGTAEPTTPRPVADTESSTPTAPAPKTARKLRKVANPIHQGTGTGPRDTSQI